LLRHILLPALGALLMTALFVAQIIEQTDAPYTWIPWVVVAWVVLLILGAAWLSVARPAILRAAGVVLG
jgi:hypothetical protein